MGVTVDDLLKNQKRFFTKKDARIVRAYIREWMRGGSGAMTPEQKNSLTFISKDMGEFLALISIIVQECDRRKGRAPLSELNVEYLSYNKSNVFLEVYKRYAAKSIYDYDDLRTIREWCVFLSFTLTHKKFGPNYELYVSQIITFLSML